MEPPYHKSLSGFSRPTPQSPADLGSCPPTPVSPTSSWSLPSHDSHTGTLPGPHTQVSAPSHILCARCPPRGGSSRQLLTWLLRSPSPGSGSVVTRPSVHPPPTPYYICPPPHSVCLLSMISSEGTPLTCPALRVARTQCGVSRTGAQVNLYT